MSDLLTRMEYATHWLINKRDYDAVKEGIEEIKNLQKISATDQERDLSEAEDEILELLEDVKFLGQQVLDLQKQVKEKFNEI